MADDSMALLETLRKVSAEGDGDVLREGVRVLAQAIMEAEVTELTGRAQGRARPRAPPDPPQRVSRAALGHARGHDRRSPSRGSATATTSRRCSNRGVGPSGPCSRSSRRPTSRASPPAGWTTWCGPWASRASARARSAASAPRSTPRSRPSGAGPSPRSRYPYVWLDATYLKVREGGRVVSMAALVATGVLPSGERRVLGLELAAGNDEGSAWPRFIRSPRRARPPRGAPRHQRRPRGPGQGRRASSSWAPRWQRCRVHLTRNAQDLVPRSARSMVASAVRIGLRAARRAVGPGAARPGHRRLPAALSRRSPNCSPRPSPTCSPTSPSPRPTGARSARTNPLERLNKEIKRRTAVVGIFPNRAAAIRLVGMLLAEQDDEWQDGRRYFRPETLALIDADPRRRCRRC